jgi:Holliday junction resolvasome RuvABC DNA-binding subunit
MSQKEQQMPEFATQVQALVDMGFRQEDAQIALRR